MYTDTIPIVLLRIRIMSFYKVSNLEKNYGNKSKNITTKEVNMAFNKMQRIANLFAKSILS